MSLRPLQVCFAPCFLASFLCISGALNGLTVEENVDKLKRVRVLRALDELLV